MSNTGAKRLARASMAQLAALGNKIVSFVGAEGPVDTVGLISQNSGIVLLEASLSEERYKAYLLVEDVGQPHRNDTITDEDGQIWRLLEAQASADPFICVWTIEQKWPA
jgi:hypothetical protein